MSQLKVFTIVRELGTVQFIQLVAYHTIKDKTLASK